jgi:hypothetical protein
MPRRCRPTGACSVPGAGGVTVKSMRVTISPEAAEFTRAHGGALWVWVTRPRLCCTTAALYLHATTEPPEDGRAGFRLVPVVGLDLWFRAPVGPPPDTLEIALRGKRHSRLEAYWDGCLFALNA